MLAKVFSASVIGVDAFPVEVEVHAGWGLPAVVVVGLPDAAVKESRDRVRTALENSGYKTPIGRTTVNLAPADVRKEGPSFDLPMAIGVLIASGQLDSKLIEEYFITGELALNGQTRPVKGALAIAIAARKHGRRGVILPKANAREAGVVEGLDVIGVGSLREAVEFLCEKIALAPTRVDAAALLHETEGADADFSEVRGQEHVKRALEVAVAGGHNVLMIGPPGTGKSMLAKRLPTIFPPLSLEEALETTKIHSVAGTLPADAAIVRYRPFRGPHHTISDAGLIGGTADPRPGEVSLAHHGVLFLDELPEFRRSALEVLRQPLEDGHVTISRAAGSMTFPAQFMLVAAMNPTPTGGFGDAQRGRVTAQEARRYLNKISGPLLDRIDIHVEVPAVGHELLSKGEPGEPSAAIRSRVVSARRRQHERFSKAKSRRTRCNAHMTPKELRTHAPLAPDCQDLLRIAMSELGLSARAHDRILRVARTIADLAGRDAIAAEDISEAIQYRTLDRQLWG